MLNFSYLDPQLLFPNMTGGWALAINSFTVLLEFATLILMVVAEWQLFKKFGEKPWKSLIPYYNSFILYKHTWSKKAFWVFTVSTTLFDVCHGVSTHLAKNAPDSTWMTLLVLISLPFGIIAAVCSILYAFRLAEAFGKGKVFSVGLLAAYSIFVAILGLGKTPYLGNSNANRIDNEAEASPGKGEGI